MKSFFKSYCLYLSLFMLATACSNSKTQEPVIEAPVVSQASYSPESIVFSLNLLSNILFGVDTTLQVLEADAPKAMEMVLGDSTVQQKIGKWSIVWGPVIYSSRTSDVRKYDVVDNLLVLFRNESKTNGVPEYVLATSGTNDISKFGWFDEDFDVYKMINWPNKTTTGSIRGFVKDMQGKGTTSPNGKAVSIGTATGISKLLEMKDGARGTIYSALKDLNLSNTTIAVAGHSLGGALSPTLALALKDYQQEWNPDATVRITTYPTAGASPGNKAFREYFYTQFNGNFFGKMNLNDMVPHAWQANLLDSIPQLYKGEPYIQNVCLIDNLMSKVQGKIKRVFGSNSYASLYCEDNGLTPDPNKSFMEPYDSTLMSKTVIDEMNDCCKHYLDPFKKCNYKDLSAGYLTVMGELGCSKGDGARCDQMGATFLFLKQAGYQHTTAYNNYYGIQLIQDKM
ncbi:MAG: hypothetical protein AAFX87_31635, partial [Bacteroidota bacterium]